MNVQAGHETQRVQPVSSRLGIADCDIHHSPKPSGLLPYLDRRWHDRLATFGGRGRQGNAAGPQYPKGQPDAARRDAWPEDGGRPGSDLALMQRQHLDPNGIELGILNMIVPHPGGYANQDMAAALCRAINDWQVTEWTSEDPRLKASLVVPYEDAPAAIAEIERWAGHPDIVQVLLLSRTREPLGSRRYWPVYEAAARAGLPVGVHAFGHGGHATTSGGWPSYYIEDMVGHAQSCQAGISSMVLEGVFEHVPALKVVMVEAGFAWLPALAWRLDRTAGILRAETPHLKRLPSDYIRDHIWLTTQPMEEPEPAEHLRDTIAWIGWDRLVFATDYPHWDYDAPDQCLRLRITAEQRQDFFIGNARKLYGPKS